MTAGDPVPELQVERPEWLPENFNSPEDLANAFKETKSSLTQTQQQLRQQEEEFEAFLLSDERIADEKASLQMSREQQLAVMQRLAEQAAYAGARRVVKAVNTGRVQAPDDPEVLARVTAQVMPKHDPRWNETSADMIANVLTDRPELLSDMGDMDAIVSGLSTAAEIARGRQASHTLSAWQRAEESRQAKLNAQTLTGAGARSEPQDDDSAFFERLKHAHQVTYAASRNA